MKSIFYVEMAPMFFNVYLEKAEFIYDNQNKYNRTTEEKGFYKMDGFFFERDALKKDIEGENHLLNNNSIMLRTNHQ